ncbi:hypothetical protein EZV62_016367 [Acer yangbiense]|uniref:Anaphase-promoting complex subunit 11 n=1 Tax=Acer yangbiense TaxID=1000413 RepID=A0A5C7HP18_9ROSI|nr:hypothetical protein EZV62_016367 [Acer yangbiense]
MAFDGCCPDCKLPGDDCPLRISQDQFLHWNMIQKVLVETSDFLIFLFIFLYDVLAFEIEPCLDCPQIPFCRHGGRVQCVLIDFVRTNDLSLLAVWGACNHAFHLHCILKWVNSQTPQALCPMCRREWQFKA